jgi:hypothetical protein
MTKPKNFRIFSFCFIFLWPIVIFNSDNVQGQSCTFSISPTNVTAPIKGLPDPSDPRIGASVTPKITVTASNEECGWTASTNANWIQLLASGGKGSGSLQYKVVENNTGAMRTGAIQVAGKTVTIQQDSSTVCSFSVSPTSVSVSEMGAPDDTDPRAGASSSPPKLTITASRADCQWMVGNYSSWIQLVNSKGKGSGYVEYRVMKNTSGSPRTGIIEVEGRTVKINQEYSTPCSFSVSPTSISIRWEGTDSDPRKVASPPFELTLTSSKSNCPWTATTSVSWIKLVTSNGTGSGAVQYRVLENTSGSRRIGTIKVGGQTVTVTQGTEIVK